MCSLEGKSGRRGCDLYVNFARLDIIISYMITALCGCVAVSVPCCRRGEGGWTKAQQS